MAKKPRTAKAEAAGVYVYLGPSIRGVVQHGTIYRGKRAEVIQSLAPAVEKYPKIARLIVADFEISAAKEKIKSGGNALSAAYKALLAANL